MGWAGLWLVFHREEQHAPLAAMAGWCGRALARGPAGVSRALFRRGCAASGTLFPADVVAITEATKVE